MVWDPVIELRFTHNIAQAAGEEWISRAYELPPDEVLEIFRMEIIPPVTTAGVIRKLRYVTLRIDDNEYETLHLSSIMAPHEHPNNVGVAIDFGVPLLWRPIIGSLPSPIEATCPKVKRGSKLTIKTIADEAIAATEPYTIVLKAARVRGADKLAEIVGTTSYPVSIVLNGEPYSKDPVPVTLENFDELPGGLRQSKPQIFPWFTYAKNRVDTTPNTWYEFTYDSYVAYSWMQLQWNLVNKSEAYCVEHIGVIPHSNSKALRLYVEGRVTNPEFTTRPLPESNFFMPPMFYETSVNAGLKRAGPVKLPKPFLFHGVKGGIQIIDNGTSIPAGGVEVMVYGKKIVLR